MSTIVIVANVLVAIGALYFLSLVCRAACSTKTVAGVLRSDLAAVKRLAGQVEDEIEEGIGELTDFGKKVNDFRLKLRGEIEEFRDEVADEAEKAKRTIEREAEEARRKAAELLK